ncbi:MAG: hypothetical protein AVDCRST_MAG53-1650, partial [uncultured Solirubrobacteraceae bacterium]
EGHPGHRRHPRRLELPACPRLVPQPARPRVRRPAVANPPRDGARRLGYGRPPRRRRGRGALGRRGPRDREEALLLDDRRGAATGRLARPRARAQAGRPLGRDGLEREARGARALPHAAGCPRARRRLDELGRRREQQAGARPRGGRAREGRGRRGRDPRRGLHLGHRGRQARGRPDARRAHGRLQRGRAARRRGPGGLRVDQGTGRPPGGDAAGL